MIILRTGVPGSGKTLSMIEQLALLILRWATHPEELRPVYVHNIKNLALPHFPLPLKQYQARSSDPIVWVPDWDVLPDGALILIDEAQGSSAPDELGREIVLFPPRSSASKAPPHVAFLNTHRHRGFDIWLATQHPKLLDMTVRALVGKHQHYRRMFGGSRAMVYEWDSCSDNLSGMKTAVISYWPYPKKVFKWYKSAEVHTKQEFKLPKWLIIPVIGIVASAFALPQAYSVMFGSDSALQGARDAAESIKATPESRGEVRAQAAGSPPPAEHPAPLPASEVLTEKKNRERTVGELKIAHGVYSDDPTDRQHYTDEDLERQRRALEILEAWEAQRPAQQKSVFVSPSPGLIKITSPQTYPQNL